jgi:hypothetical protein
MRGQGVNVSITALRAMSPSQRRAFVKADAAAACARKGGKPGATPRAEWTPPAPAIHANADKVLGLIRQGHHTTRDMKLHTRMAPATIHTALIHLLEHGTITSRRAGQGGNGLMLWYEEAK